MLQAAALRISFVNESEHAAEYDPQRKHSPAPNHVTGAQKAKPTLTHGPESKESPIDEKAVPQERIIFIRHQ